MKFLKSCYNKETGGFGGGPIQQSHLAPTYSAVNCLAELDLPESIEFLISIKPTLVKFINSLKQPDGSFTMHQNGEWDTRSAYTAISVAKLLKLDGINFTNTFDWLISCITFEGGFGGIPGAEAHGGYTFCGLSGLVLLDLDKVTSEYIETMGKVLGWLARRQMSIEGGFNGRTNKLVDACYSFWQGGCFPILEKYVFGVDHKMYSDIGLSSYVLACCQGPRGGVKDKPGKGPDYYHTCYGLSGYSFTNHGQCESDLAKVNPLYNVCEDYADTLQKQIDRSIND